MKLARCTLLLALCAPALAPLQAQEAGEGTAEAAPVDSAAEAAAVASATARKAAYLALAFDRSPAAVLEALTTPERPQPEPEAKPASGPKPDAPPRVTPGDPPPGPFADEALAFRRRVILGDWPAVGQALRALPEDDAREVYRHLLRLLAAPPGSLEVRGPDGPRVQPAMQERQAGALAQSQALTPADLRGLADAAPGTLEDDDLDLLGPLLAAVIAQGHALDEVLAAWRAGTARLGGEDPGRRLAVARILLAADRPREADAFLPPAAEAKGAETLCLLIRQRLGLHELEPKLEHLEAAWTLDRRLLELEGVKPELRQKALAWAVDLAPQVRESLGQAWLQAVFQDTPVRGREVLGAIGAGVAGARAKAFRDPDARLRGLRLQRTAVEALLSYAPGQAAKWTAVLGLLARNWVVEAELSRDLDQSVSGGRPQPRYDPYGNLYFLQDRGQSGPNQPLPIPTVDVLAEAPSQAWRELAGASLRAHLVELATRLQLKAGDEDAAFPLLQTLAAMPGEAEAAHDLAEELLKVWTQNHDLNDSAQRRNRYVFWGFERRADGIPLTRSKQERNLTELAALLERLRALPLQKPLDEKLLADAFIRSHSQAEVYQLASIERVFGPPQQLEPPVLARLIQTMRTNLAGLWRDPRVQKKNETKRTDRELQAQVLRGYQVARRLASDGLAEHPQSWELLLADASVRYDQADYEHRELGSSPEYAASRREALARFAAAAQAYAGVVQDLSEEEESNDVYDLWFAASLGACDLPRISHEHVPDPAQPALIKAAMEALPGEAAERHLDRFANSLFARMSALNPAVKCNYLRAGFEIVGDREEAREARKVFQYYQDLVTEIQLRTRLDGSDRVGHERPFGVFVELRHTEEIEREAGGFGKYLQNQNSMGFAWNYGRPLEDYRDKFEEAVRALLEERFEVRSITFADPKVESRADPQQGWRVTPYAYLLLQARGPEVDELPPLSLDLDFLDTSGYAVLPVESAPIPLDSRPATGDPRPLTDLEVTESLDERRAGEGVLALEVQAKGHGLIPPLKDLLDLEHLDPAFEMTQVEDPGVAADELDLSTEELAVTCERRWLLELRGKEGLQALPRSFHFPAVRLDAKEVVRQRYVDADLVQVGEQVPLEQTYGETAPRWPWALAAALLLLLLAVATRWLPRPQPEEPQGPFALPTAVTPFSVLALLQRIRAEGELDPAEKAELQSLIAGLQQRHFQGGNGQEPAPGEDLPGLARRWVERGNAAARP